MTGLLTHPMFEPGRGTLPCWQGLRDGWSVQKGGECSNSVGSVHRVPSPRSSALAVALLAIATLGACGGDRAARAGGFLSAAGEATGLTDPLAPPPEAIDLLCQVSDVSPCNPHRFAATLDAAASFARARPSATLRTWTVDASPTGATLVGTLLVPERGNQSPRRALQEERQFVEATRAALCPAVFARMTDSTGDGVALAEALTKVSLAASGGLPRRIVVLSHGYESGVSRFRCRPLPTVAQWQALLARRHLLTVGSLTNSTVHFGHMDLATAPRRRDCPSPSIARDLHVRELWRSALIHAGAVRVTFDLGAPDLEALSHEATPARRIP